MGRNKKPKKHKFNPIILLFFLIFASIGLILIYSYITRHNDAFEIRTDLYDLSSECSLSLCDCNCYPTKFLPEIVEGKICGNDCFGFMGIVGCQKMNDSCVIEYK